MEEERKEQMPKYCTNCGKRIRKYSSTGRELQIHCFNNAGDGMYDIYCWNCGWSGDIRPDSETELYIDDIRYIDEKYRIADRTIYFKKDS
jgi:hypothetical protein